MSDVILVVQFIDDENCEPSEVEDERIINLMTNTITKGMVALKRIFYHDKASQ